jgi:hypothetical protein
MRSGIAAVIGFLSAPLVSAFVMTGYTLLADGRGLSGGLLLLPIYYYGSAVPTLLLGIPAFLVLSRFDAVRWWSALLVGVVIGMVAGAVLGVRFIGPLGLLVMACAGAVSALTFWLIWRCGKERQALVTG